jgi:hypothetical protein
VQGRAAEAAPAEGAAMTEIATIFSKKPDDWTKEDVAATIAAYREYMTRLRELGQAIDPKTGEPKKKPVKRRKADPRQIDIEELIDAKNGR